MYPDFFDNAIVREPLVAVGPEVCLFRLKEMLKDAGWAVKASGDGRSAYSASGDVITNTSTGDNGMANVRAWFRIASPDDVVEFTFQVIVVLNNHEVRIKSNFGRAGLFTGGAPDAETTPSATSEIVLNGGGTDASPTGVGWWHGNSTDAGARAYGAAETVYPYRFWWTSNASASPYTKGAMLALDTVIPVDPSDTDIYVIWHQMVRANLNWGSVHFSSLTDAQARLVGFLDETFVRLYAQRLADASTGTSAHPTTGALSLCPVYLSRRDNVTTPNGDKGFATLLRYMPQTTTTPYSRQLNAQNGRRYIYTIGNGFHLPWPSASLFSHNTTWTQVDAHVFSAIGGTSVDSDAPVVTVVSPAIGSTIGPSQVITVDVTDETSISALAIIASFVDGSAEVVHDGFAFRGRYRSVLNTRTSITGGHRYTIHRDGGWRQAPTLEYLVVDGGGNVGALA